MGHTAWEQSSGDWQSDSAGRLGSRPTEALAMLLATAGLAHDLHHDFVQIGAGGVQRVDAAH